MAVVRYVALAALVVWLGALQGALVGYRTTHASALQYACGAVLLVSLFAMKFLGPPPRAFVARVAIVMAMLGLMFLDGWWDGAAALTVINTALGFVLLSWYARE